MGWTESQTTDMRRPAVPGATALKCRYAGAAALAAAIFAIDTFTTLGSAVAVLYVLVLIVVGDTPSRSVIRASAAACIVLTLFSFLYGHGLSGGLEVVLRLVFSLSAILATAFIILKRHADRMTVASQAELLDVTSDAIFLRDAAGHVIYWNKGAEALYGRCFDETWRQDAHALLQTRFPQARAAISAQLAATGAWEGELTQMTRDGRSISVFSRWRQRPGLGRSPGTVLETNTDITARKAADAALRRSERRYRTIFETLAVAILEHDLRDVTAALEQIALRDPVELEAHLVQNPDLVLRLRRMVRITDVNETGLKMFDVTSKDDFFETLDAFLPQSDQSFIAFLMALATQAPRFETEARIRTRKGRELRVIVAFNFPSDGGLERVQGSILDITERIRVQEALDHVRGQLDQAMRAATMGEVSASIAHEINQPLAAIVTSAAAARRWMDRTPPDLLEVRAALDEAAASANRASEVVRRVRTLMANAEPDRVPLEIDPVVEEAVSLVRKDLVLQSVVLSSTLEAPGRMIRGDRILLQQVMINLVTNAVQALQTVPADQRRLTVRTCVRAAGVTIEVADSGPGFSGPAAERAFEPFFTTKPSGMGLGLAMCRTIVQVHEGDIAIAAPDSGTGSCVSIWLPEVTLEVVSEVTSDRPDGPSRPSRSPPPQGP